MPFVLCKMVNYLQRLIIQLERTKSTTLINYSTWFEVFVCIEALTLIRQKFLSPPPHPTFKYSILILLCCVGEYGCNLCYIINEKVILYQRCSYPERYLLLIIFVLSPSPLFSFLQSDEDCCNSCEDVREAYRKKGWALSNPDLIDQVCLHRSLFITIYPEYTIILEK